jgi:hypothetical protein
MRPIRNFIFRIQITDRDGRAYEDFYLQQPSNVEKLAAEQIRCYIEKHYATYEEKDGVTLLYPRYDQ